MSRLTCNDCGRDIDYCDRHGCREVNGVAWAKPREELEAQSEAEIKTPTPSGGAES